MSTYVDATIGSLEHCQEMAIQFPDLAENYYNKIEWCCKQKLWHQLTIIILQFVSDEKKITTLRPLNNSENGFKNTFLGLYNKVVVVVAEKINQLSLSRITSSVAFCSLEAGTTLEESCELLQTLLKTQESKHPKNIAAVLYLQSKISLLKLQATIVVDGRNGPNNDEATKEKLNGTYSTIKTNGPLLKQLVSDTPESMIVNAAHYEASMNYYKIVGPPEAFYNEAVDYLNYYQPKDAEHAATNAKLQTLAVDLCLAALTGEGIYNLGQVVNNPILKVLVQTSQAWLLELLQACASGDVRQFQTMRQETYPKEIASQPALVNMGRQMQEKITLLSLVELVFTKPASERTLSFEEIAKGLGIPLEQIERVIMRAFSVKLMEGSMDQVDGTVHITWILPRALGTQQMTELAARFGEWACKVSTAKDVMEETEICPQ